MLVNSFVLSTSDFLNKFSSLCEQKLSSVSSQVARVEIVLALLEAKLDSIEWMGTGGGGAAAAAATNAGAAGDTSASASSAAAAAPIAPPIAAEPAAAAPPADANANVLKLKDDPRYSKYFKMLNMGVPKQAIRQRMTTDGCVDPNQIDNDPDGPAPPPGPDQPSQAIVAIETGSDSEQSDKMSDDEEGN